MSYLLADGYLRLSREDGKQALTTYSITDLRILCQELKTYEEVKYVQWGPPFHFILGSVNGANVIMAYKTPAFAYVVGISLVLLGAYITSFYRKQWLMTKVRLSKFDVNVEIARRVP